MKVSRLKVWGSKAPTEQIGKIGSKAAGNPQTTTDLEEIQSLEQYEQGLFFTCADKGKVRVPFLQDENAFRYLTTSCVSELQHGLAEWNPQIEYLPNDTIQYEGVLYTAIDAAEGANLNRKPPEHISQSWKHTFKYDDPVLQEGDQINLPIGFTYIQLPGTPTPRQMNFKGKWDEIIGFANMFMRMANHEGIEDGATEFGPTGSQAAQDNSVSTVEFLGEDTVCAESSTSRVEIPAKDHSSCLKINSLAPNVRSLFHTGKMRFSRPGREERPLNFTFRAWKRVVETPPGQ